MTRRRHEDESSIGQDSFLDIVTNIVGILIVLVLVVGIRVKNAPIQLSIPSPEREAARKELALDEQTEASLHGNVLDVVAQIEEVERTREARFRERARLSLAVATVQQELDKRRGELDAESRRRFELHQSLRESQVRLEELRREQQYVAQATPGPVRVQSYPTPLGKVVHGPELHLQLRGGRLVVVPLDALVEELKAVFRQKMYRMDRQTELTDRLGPIGGFRMQYTMRRYDTPMQVYEKTGQGGSYVRVEEFKLLPESNELGEPFDAAMAEGSAFRQALARCSPGRTTVTVWTYPDSFDQFRRLKEDLFRRGFATAARPMPEGEPIGGSPEGSRSAAE